MTQRAAIESPFLQKRLTHLAHQVGAGGAGMSGQTQQQRGEQHGCQDEKQVVDYNADQDEVPGPVAPLPAGVTVTKNPARHIHAEEDETHCSVCTPRCPSGETQQEQTGSIIRLIVRMF